MACPVRVTSGLAPIPEMAEGVDTPECLLTDRLWLFT